MTSPVRPPMGRGRHPGRTFPSPHRLVDLVVASDPGLVRLRSASVTVATLATSLGVLYAVTTIAGQAFTVALLGVVISMISSMALNDRRPLTRVVTAACLLAVAAAAVSLGAMLASHTVGGDVVFVAIMVGATLGRRLGPRGTVCGMAGFMTYFFALFLGATVTLLPWLIAALAVGTVVSLVMGLVLRERPQRQARRVERSLRARVALVVAVIADGEVDRDRRRLGTRLDRLRRTTVMVDRQLAAPDGNGGPDPGGPAARAFDVELATERLCRAWVRADPAGTGEDLDAAVGVLETGLRRGRGADLARAAALAEHATETEAAPRSPALARAVAELARAAAELDADAVPTPVAEAGGSGAAGGPAPAATATPTPAASPAAPGGSLAGRLSATTRQAVQVAVASSLAIVAGEQVSSARWYWAVIAAFVIYSGTSSSAEILARGRQRVLGTIAGVAIGAVVASVVAGNVDVSIALIFVSLFVAFYLRPVSYAFMALGTTTMLALLYGLLGEFSIGLLATRIAETAIGAGIGILTAVFVLPTSSRGTVRDQLAAYLASLDHVIGTTAGSGAGEGDSGAATAELDQHLDAYRTSVGPLGAGITGLRPADTVGEAMALLTACDLYAHGLVLASGGLDRPELAPVVDHLRANLASLGAAVTGGDPVALRAGDDVFDAAQTAAGGDPDRDLALRYLRLIDLALARFAEDVLHSPPATDATADATA